MASILGCVNMATNVSDPILIGDKGKGEIKLQDHDTTSSPHFLSQAAPPSTSISSSNITSAVSPLSLPRGSHSTIEPGACSEAPLSPTRQPSQPTHQLIGSLQTPILSAGQNASDAATRQGSAAHPIDLEDISPDCHIIWTNLDPFIKRQHSISDSTSEAEHLQQLEGSDDDITPDNRVLIDLEELENFDDLWNDEEELQILRVEQRKTSRSYVKSPKLAAVQRNPPVVTPDQVLHEYHHENLRLLPSKTVELCDGDLLIITRIIRIASTNNVMLRGRRLQRCRCMNGLLEKQLNEVCFFEEVDLDDARPSVEQSVVEVSLNDVLRLRKLRRTNQVFPLGRNLEVNQYGSLRDAEETGGVTVRWKYTCTYATATDRWNNNPQEKTLMLLPEDECTNGFGTSSEAKRFTWRGETILGGAFQPILSDGRSNIEEIRTPSLTNLDISSSDSDSDCAIIDSRTAKAATGKASFVPASDNFSPSSRKRQVSSSSLDFLQNEPKKILKKQHVHTEDVQIVSPEFEDLTLGDVEPRIPSAYEAAVIDLTGSSASPNMQNSSSQQKRSSISPIPVTIDLSDSDLSLPPSTGSVRCSFTSTQVLTTRNPGQTLTYGDAFCGAGGATRGAFMAGLKVLWGFDHWSNACSSWRLNFPQAECYELSSQDFVIHAQGSEDQKSVNMKVDLLHLSPPCQYFSPAHTVHCATDEMNVASLFAVGPVIKVARPRVVTLEQTFGIVAVRFRKYFNSLIQMFAALSFSVRWAIIPLAQWGLPQRRFRLIIIASCPGEILPRMPPPTHADPNSSSFPSRNLAPYNTINSTLSALPRSSSSTPLFPPHKWLPPYNGDVILPRTITTSGAQNYHPSGTRDFTLPEYAALQGFPPNHVFGPPYVKKQIGNAVPPCVAKVIFESIRRELDARDGVVGVESVVID